jgi:hypothetical protein
VDAGAGKPWIMVFTLRFGFGGMRQAHAYTTIDFLTSLSDTELAFSEWKSARHAYDRQPDTLGCGQEKRQVRRKTVCQIAFDASDYVMSFLRNTLVRNFPRAGEYGRSQAQKQDYPEQASACNGRRLLGRGKARLQLHARAVERKGLQATLRRGGVSSWPH